jgi:hypothetical protein
MIIFSAFVLVCGFGLNQSLAYQGNPAKVYNQMVRDFNKRNAAALWHSLPYRYQRDVKNIIRRIPDAMDRDTYTRTVKLTRRFSAAAPKKRRYVLNLVRVLYPLEARNIQGTKFNAFVTILKELSHSELANYDNLRHPDIERFVRRRGYRLMQAALTISGKEGEDYVSAVSRSRARLLQRHGSRARVEIVFYPRKGRAYKRRVNFKRVDGRWVMTEFANNWAEGVRAAHQQLSQVGKKPDSGLAFYKRKLPLFEQYMTKFEKVSSEKELLALQFEILLGLTDAKDIFGFGKSGKK